MDLFPRETWEFLDIVKDGRQPVMKSKDVNVRVTTVPRPSLFWFAK